MEVASGVVDLSRETRLGNLFVLVEPLPTNPRKFYIRIRDEPGQRGTVRHRKLPRRSKMVDINRPISND